MQRISRDLYRALMEIMPSDSYTIQKVKKVGDAVYQVYAEDSEYRYIVEVCLRPHGENEHHYKLLDFSYEEKRK